MEVGQISGIIKRHFKTTSGKKALDLGCGTGPTTLTLHQLGFETTGIDISPTAIELAKKMNPSIHFEVADVLTYREKFDFIYDSHCLHCIVTVEDRRDFFHMLKENLAPDGFAFIDTMTWREGYQCDIPTLKFDENYILWHPRKDKTWCEQRRIYPAAKVLEEIHEAGLKVVFKNEVIQPKPEPNMLQILVSL